MGFLGLFFFIVGMLLTLLTLGFNYAYDQSIQKEIDVSYGIQKHFSYTCWLTLMCLGLILLLFL